MSFKILRAAPHSYEESISGAVAEAGLLSIRVKVEKRLIVQPPMKSIRRCRAKYGPTTPGPFHICHLVAIVRRRIDIDKNTWTDNSSLKNNVIVRRAVVHDEVQLGLVPMKPV